MLTTSQIDAAMEELETLAPLLSAEIGADAAQINLSPPARAYKEALMTTRVLAEKLRVVRIFCSSHREPYTRCINCDDV
jgi:hypothetical protein